MNSESVSRPDVSGEELPAERFGTWEDAKPIIIHAGHYMGVFKVDGGQALEGKGPDNTVEISLLKGLHEISFLSGYFLIYVDEDGKVTQIMNPSSATAEGNRLFFQTQRIAIDPGEFGCLGGKCELSNYPCKRFGLIQDKPKEFDLVAGVLHQFDSGAHIGQAPDKKLAGSFLSFMVRKDGTVWSNSSAARGGEGVLRLNCGIVRILPGNPRLKYEVGVNCRKENGDLTESLRYAGTRDVPVILGLRTSLFVPAGQMIAGVTYREACAYFNPEYGSHDSRDLVVGDAAFRWRLLPEGP